MIEKVSYSGVTTVAGGFQVSGTDFYIGYTVEANRTHHSLATLSPPPRRTLCWRPDCQCVDLWMSGDSSREIRGASPSHHRHESGGIFHEPGLGQPDHSANRTDLGLSGHERKMPRGSVRHVGDFPKPFGGQHQHLHPVRFPVQPGPTREALFFRSGATWLILQGTTAWAVASNIPGNFADTGLPGPTRTIWKKKRQLLRLPRVL